MVSEEVQRTAIIVADGEYEKYLKRKEDDDCPDTCHDGYAGCHGGCGVDSESCRWHTGKNQHGHWVGWCMCGNKEKSRQRFAEGLGVAREYLPVEEFEKYTARLEQFLAAG